MQDPIPPLIKNMVFLLLIIQVLYKLSTPLIVGIENPVVISNLLISALHIVTLSLIWKERYPFA